MSSVNIKNMHESPLEPITLVVTCFNEENTVMSWCQSFLAMDKLPQELIIADSDSTDGTIRKLREGLNGYKGQLVILEERCNIAAGRNKAINSASHTKIAITDFGVTFHPSWLTNISVNLDYYDWVGGVYELVSSNPIEESFCRLFNTPINKIDASSFLPSSRSFGVNRKVFEWVKGYNESLVIGEDTDLVLRLKSTNLTYHLVREAIVFWRPRSSIKLIFIQNFRYAYWDGLALQNLGRFKHIIFCVALLATPILGALIFAVKGALLGLMLSISVLFIKTKINTRRSCSGTPRFSDMFVYVTTMFASGFGFICGVFYQIRRYK